MVFLGLFGGLSQNGLQIFPFKFLRTHFSLQCYVGLTSAVERASVDNINFKSIYLLHIQVDSIGKNDYAASDSFLAH
jgi:hypothetical protein